MMVNLICKSKFGPSLEIKFTVKIMDPCLKAEIQLPFMTLADMNYSVAFGAVSQTFAAATDSKSAFFTITSYCGPIEYSISEAYSFTTVNQTQRTVSVQTNLFSDAGNHPATLEAKLTNYPGVPHAKVTFSIFITNPCFTTALSFPTTLAPISIISKTNIGFSSSFAPAIDSAAATAGTPGLCGDRLYSILEP